MKDTKVIQLDIQSKYFDAILSLQKPFEIRHKKYKKGSIIQLREISTAAGGEGNIYTGRYIVFECGKCEEINKIESIIYDHGHTMEIIQNEADEKEISVDYLCSVYSTNDSWYDEFCWQYISKKQSYIIPIAKILAVNSQN